MSWKESKVRLLPPGPPISQNLADRKPDIQDLFLLASQATALSEKGGQHGGHAPPSTHNTHGVPTHLPLHPVKIETPVIHPLPSSDPSTSLSVIQRTPVNSQHGPMGGPTLNIVTHPHPHPDSAMMPPPPPPPPRAPASPGVSSTSDGDESSMFCQNSPSSSSAIVGALQSSDVANTALGKTCFFCYFYRLIPSKVCKLLH